MKTFTHEALYEQLGLTDAPLIVDVRSAAERDRLPRMIPSALWLEGKDVEQWSRRLPPRRTIAVYCADGETSADVVTKLCSRGMPAATLAGGIAGWVEHGRPTINVRREYGVPGSSRWITRERPKIDRLACPWLIRRFIDPQALFFYVPAPHVRAEGVALGAEPFDIADVTFSHRGPRCSFDAFLDEFDLHDPVIDALADIVRAADTGALAHSREAPGLLALSIGLSVTIPDDILLLEQAMSLYDALYAWCKTARHETHFWPQAGAA
jgi:rhodanese-related sulfurtransferase